MPQWIATQLKKFPWWGTEVMHINLNRGLNNVNCKRQTFSSISLHLLSFDASLVPAELLINIFSKGKQSEGEAFPDLIEVPWKLYYLLYEETLFWCDVDSRKRGAFSYERIEIKIMGLVADQIWGRNKKYLEPTGAHLVFNAYTTKSSRDELSFEASIG